jgi:lysine 2,3-aminomutase
MFAVKTNPYLEELISVTSKNVGEENSPVAIQFRHSDKEYVVLDEENIDYLGEDCRTHCDGFITQKYPNRMLVYASDTCAALCRHCTRKRKVHDKIDFKITSEMTEGLVEYIKENKIVDVLISGGDPFMLNKMDLIELVMKVKRAFHENGTKGVIRLGTRVPCTNPRIINEVWKDIDFKILATSGVQYINVQFNCVEELTDEAKAAITKIRSNGISINNQSVLLKGVNDSAEALINLNVELYSCGVRPYYLYSCDLIPGMSHFRVSIKRGISLYESMRGVISGLANPLYIADLPDGMGKTPINPHYYKEIDEGIYQFNNYEGRTFIYKDKEVTINEY